MTLSNKSFYSKPILSLAIISYESIAQLDQLSSALTTQSALKIAEQDEAINQSEQIGIELKVEDFLLNQQQAKGYDGINQILIEKLLSFPLIQIRFPKFQDGRAYSMATLLKKQYGYSGELRAAGPLHADQASFLVEVGFDSIALENEQVWEDFIKMMGVVKNRYQWHQYGHRQGRSLN
jgi:uncharacterized protein (DUF934 family)